MRNTLAKVFSAELEGVNARLVEVEVDMNVGISSFTIVGLADKSVNEARERVSSAIKNTGIKPPNRDNRRITVNLAPADVKKNGSQYDVPIAIGYLMASEQITKINVSKKLFVGELGLDGKIRKISGILNICQLAKDKKFEEVFIPYSNATEASLINDIKIFPIKTFKDLILHIEDIKKIKPIKYYNNKSDNINYAVDFSDIKGQDYAKRALTIAAAGGHNIYMTGTPGAGKTMLANALISILPDMTYEEMLEVMRIWSASGTPRNKNQIFIRPFRAPHHSASLVSIVGGGQNPKPGEISLAHNGVLFLDEIPEFNRRVLESLRQPLENGHVVVSRARKSLIFPAKTMLVAASNPCPCGYFRDTEKTCLCTPNEISKYQKKISGPLLDRIDIQIWVNRIKSKDLEKNINKDKSLEIKKIVNNARERQIQRFKKYKIPILSNREMTSRQIESYVEFDYGVKSILEKALDSATITARGFFKTIRVAQTIADLDDRDKIKRGDILEALSYRIKQETL